MLLFRYENFSDSSTPRLREYSVIGETECFYLINNPRKPWTTKRVSKTAARPWAYTTVKAAAQSFAMRKFRQIEKCRKDVDTARGALRLIGEEHPDIDTKEPPDEWFPEFKPFNGKRWDDDTLLCDMSERLDEPKETS